MDQCAALVVMADKWWKLLNIWLPSGFIDTSQYTQGHARLARPTHRIWSSDSAFPFPIVTQVSNFFFWRNIFDKNVILCPLLPSQICFRACYLPLPQTANCYTSEADILSTKSQTVPDVTSHFNWRLSAPFLNYRRLLCVIIGESHLWSWANTNFVVRARVARERMD